MDTLLEVEKSYEIYQKRKYLALNYAGCLIFVALAIYFILNADFLTQYCTQTHIRLCPKNPFAYYFIGGFSLLFFGVLCGSTIIQILLNPKMIFYLNNDGFYSDLCGFVDWKSVSELKLLKFSSTKFIVFNAHNSGEILSKLPARARILQKLNKPFIGGDFYISFSGSGADVDTIFKEMRQYYERNK